MLLYVEEFKTRPHRGVEFAVEDKQLDAILSGTDYRAKSLSVLADIERINSTFRIVGSIHAVVAYDCGRCLEKREQALSLTIDWVVMEKGEFSKKYATDEEIELSAEDLDVSVYEGDTIDLTELVREAILLELPTYATCPEGDAQCDADYAKNVGSKAIKQNDEATMDLRWSALKDFKLQRKD